MKKKIIELTIGNQNNELKISKKLPKLKKSTIDDSTIDDSTIDESTIDKSTIEDKNITKKLKKKTTAKKIKDDIVIKIKDTIEEIKEDIASNLNTVPELKEKCKELGIKGYSKKNKAELIAMINKK